jgi:hypothetical protein
MIGLQVKEARVFVRPGATDMRKQINGLVIVIEQVMEANVFEPSLFLFCNGERRILKAVYWDRNGFSLWQKRAEKHRFPRPRTSGQARCEIDTEKLRMLLDGIDFWSAYQELAYSRVSGRAGPQGGGLACPCRPSAADRLPPHQEWMTTFMQSGLIDFNRPSRESVK